MTVGHEVDMFENRVQEVELLIGCTRRIREGVTKSEELVSTSSFLEYQEESLKRWQEDERWV